MAFVVIGSVVSDSIIKGIISTLFGAVIGLIGEDIITGQFKMTMGIAELESGMALVPLLIGVFVISEVIIQAEKAAKVKMIDTKPQHVDDPEAHYFTWAEFKRCFPLMFRSSIYGSLIGMMPGIGSSVACFVAYGEEKRRSKVKDKWGTGIVEGSPRRNLPMRYRSLYDPAFVFGHSGLYHRSGLNRHALVVAFNPGQQFLPQNLPYLWVDS